MLKILHEYSIVDKEEVTDEVIINPDAPYAPDIIYRLEVRRILFLTNIKPDDLIDSPDSMLHHNISRVVIPQSPLDDNGVGIGRRRDDVTKGFVELKFSSPITIYVDGDFSFSEAYIIAVEDPTFSNQLAMAGEDNSVMIYKLYRALLDAADRIKTVDFQPDVVSLDALTGELREFVFKYVIRHRTEEGVGLWEDAMEQFHDLLDYSLPRSNIFRGITVVGQEKYEHFLDMLGVRDFQDIREGDSYRYRHYFDHPISTTSSYRMALSFTDYFADDREDINFGVVFKFVNISDNDIVVDMREIEGSYPLESEIILRPDKDYTVELSTLVDL